MSKYPNLEKLEKICLGNLHKLYPESFKDILTTPRLELYACFPQVWGDTAGGFSGPSMMAGQAFTTQYTSVFYVEMPKTGKEHYFVFFDNEPAYIVIEANEIFLEDLKKMRMKSKHEAEKVY